MNSDQRYCFCAVFFCSVQVISTEQTNESERPLRRFVAYGAAGDHCLALGCDQEALRVAWPPYPSKPTTSDLQPAHLTFATEEKPDDKIDTKHAFLRQIGVRLSLRQLENRLKLACHAGV